jgi:hypothetical protein
MSENVDYQYFKNVDFGGGKIFFNAMLPKWGKGA